MPHPNKFRRIWNHEWVSRGALKVTNSAPAGAQSITARNAITGKTYNITLATNFIQLIGAESPTVTFNAALDFNTFRLVISPDDKAALYVNNTTTPLLEVSSGANFTGPASILDFGDANGSMSGRVEWEYLRWTTAGAYAPIPEPSTTALIIGSISLLAIVRKIKKY